MRWQFECESGCNWGWDEWMVEVVKVDLAIFNPGRRCSSWRKVAVGSLASCPFGEAG